MCAPTMVVVYMRYLYTPKKDAAAVQVTKHHLPTAEDKQKA